MSSKNIDCSQVQNVRTMMANQAGNQMVQYSATSSGAVTPGAAGDEVRVDCCLMATDGRSVVTGSSLGPPQVWDMQVIQQACKTMQASSAEFKIITRVLFKGCL